MFKIWGSTERFDPAAYRRLKLLDIQEFDQLVELANPNQGWGRIAIRAGLGDAMAKGVPVCQHTGIVVIKNGAIYLHEAVTFISENRLGDKHGVYVVLRLKDPNRKEIGKKGYAWAKTQLGHLWGIRNAARLAWNMLWAWTGYHLDAPESDSIVCSNENAEFWDHGGRPVYKDGTDDDEVKPWDFLTPEMLQYFDVVGILDLSASY